MRLFLVVCKVDMETSVSYTSDTESEPTVLVHVACRACD